ncbi:MAG: hypothetical protein HDQ99_00905 [Lachnospiraceae bacterium]|nr:hypothetical protein [Lachnospiraceae bacterium]
MAEKFVIYVLHSSHTDVGYTDTQEKMKAHHIAFIREVLEMVRENPDFKWNCESYWCVEQFLKVADEVEKEAFVNAVLSGNIGLSASYLNLTDLVPAFVHDHVMARCKKEREALGIRAVSAMTADINGYSWGFADVLAKQGVDNLMSCIHTHHGYHPLFRKQTPFFWESPEGRQLLVWNGEHYNLGNELGIAQASWFEYTIQDGMSLSPLSDWEKAEKRITAYVDTLRQQGYEYAFAPVSLSGNMTDNSPPSPRILEFIKRYNEKGGQIELKMATLDEFFGRLRQENLEKVPVYRGDWTDWWADGVGSTPADVIQYRQAARYCHMAEKLDAAHKAASEEIYEAVYDNLMFYGEHTWGYSSSITEPFHPQVNNLDQWKRLYALKACEAATIIKEQIQADLGETALSLRKELKFRAVNPHDIPVEDMLAVDLEHFYGHVHFKVVEEESGEEVPFQLSRYSRGPKLCIRLSMQPKETKTFCLAEMEEAPLQSAGLCARTGIEGVNDLYWRLEKEKKQGACVSMDGLENRFFRITWQQDKGITSVFDKIHGEELADSTYPAFTPIYERTPRREGEDYLFVRRNMGRNRKAFRTLRSIGRLQDAKILEDGCLYTKVELAFGMEGTEECSLILTAYKWMPKLSVDFRLHKKSVWEPENVYLSLPFMGKETYLDKAGAVMRPRIDQLPGTCIDFYALQNGMVWERESSTVILASQDVPLVAMGGLEAHAIRLMGDEGGSNCDEVYSWVMNNFWETNFKASLGGFYQFHYEFFVTEKIEPQRAFAAAEAMNEGVLQFYLFA